MQDGFVKGWPLLLLRAEAAVIFGASVWAYQRLGLSWWTFAGIILLPDLGMVGYLANTTAGAALYNCVHTEASPIFLLCAAWARGSRSATGLALCWLAHIGMDRMFGIGLKYGGHFHHTHLGKLGNTIDKAKIGASQ